jgi:peptidoglycan/xylan/chitin deacetylase (PgdA/CDA1 family)
VVPSRFVRSVSRLVAVLLVAVLVTGCAAGAPSVYKPSPTPGTPEPPTEQAVIVAETAVVPTATTEALIPTVAATATEAPEPTPTTGPTPRPAPPEPTDPNVAEVIAQGTSGRNEVALTFDAGDDRGFTEEILATLEEYGVVATFGLTGEWVDNNPDLVARILAGGHQIMNHGWSHDSLTGVSDGTEGITDFAAREAELESTNGVIMAAGDGYDTRPYWRPAYGDYDESVLEDTATIGYPLMIMWSCDSLGWNGLTADEINERCTDTAEAGSIILMHVGENSQDAAALPQMIETLRANGFDLVTIEQLLQP